MCASIPELFHFGTLVSVFAKTANKPTAGGRTMRFENQAVLVSGAGRGIGKEIALSFAREGADIGFPEVNEETASATANEIRKLGRCAFFTRADVSDYDQVQQFIADAARESRPDRRADQQRRHRQGAAVFGNHARELGELSADPSVRSLLLLAGSGARDGQAQVWANRFARVGSGIHGPDRPYAIRRRQVWNYRADALDGAGTGRLWNNRQCYRTGTYRHGDGACGLEQGSARGARPPSTDPPPRQDRR